MKGVNFGTFHWFEFDGYGRMAIYLLRGLVQLGVDVYPYSREIHDNPGWIQRLQGLDYSKLTLTLLPGYQVRSLPGQQWSFSMWEADRLPAQWINNLNAYCTRAIVPARFLVDLYQQEGIRMPVDVVPGGIDPLECPILPACENEHRPFTFLCNGDRAPRKGLDQVWMGFYKAFQKREDVRLLIKCRPDSLKDLHIADSDRRISVWKSDVTNLADLHSQADCAVYPTWGEGYGLLMREAAASGLPTITSRHTGTADDIDQWAIPLEKFTKAPSNLLGQGNWLIPDVDEVADRMLWVYEHRQEARQNALKAAQWLRDNQTWQHSAVKLKGLLDTYA